MSQVYFSPSTTTFFRTDTHGVPGTESCKMPSDIVEVSQDVFEAMTEARSNGMRLIADSDGQPIAIERLAPTTAEMAENERLWRDGEIITSEWIVARHRDEVDMDQETMITPEQFSELLRYRQALRDWPTVEGFPNVDLRPNPPGWLADQTE